MITIQELKIVFLFILQSKQGIKVVRYPPWCLPRKFTAIAPLLVVVLALDADGCFSISSAPHPPLFSSLSFRPLLRLCPLCRYDRFGFVALLPDKCFWAVTYQFPD